MIEALGLIVIGVLVTLGIEWLAYHFYPMDEQRDAKVRAEQALERKRKSAERHERKKWRNWFAW